MTQTRELKRHELLTRDGDVIVVDAVLLGEGTSWAEGKDRWFEVKILADERDEYIVHTVGRSNLPGERDLGRVEHVTSPYEVIELLTVRRVAARHRDPDQPPPRPYVPRASLRALAQAAEFDDGLYDAYFELVK